MSTKLLFAALELAEKEGQSKVNKVKEQIQKSLNVRFDDWSALQKAITANESASMYQFDEHGDVVRWFRFSELRDVEENEREYLENYLEDSCIRIDWENNCFETSVGNCILVLSEGRSDHVYDQDAGKIVIEGDEYTEDGEVNEDLRNELIEAYMERTGCFPDVLRCTPHGDLFPLNTQKVKP